MACRGNGENARRFFEFLIRPSTAKSLSACSTLSLETFKPKTPRDSADGTGRLVLFASGGANNYTTITILQKSFRTRATTTVPGDCRPVNIEKNGLAEINPPTISVLNNRPPMPAVSKNGSWSRIWRRLFPPPIRRFAENILGISRRDRYPLSLVEVRDSSWLGGPSQVGGGTTAPVKPTKRKYTRASKNTIFVRANERLDVRKRRP